MRFTLKAVTRISLAVAVAGALGWMGLGLLSNTYADGRAVERLDDVAVYDNGPIFTVAHGRNYAADGYYFGQKWQCVEFIKRYLYTAKGLRMPDVWGHAISFFDQQIAQGVINPRRGMVQFRHGGDVPPQPGDLLVFSGAGGYGHVAIVAAVGDGHVEILQQNSPPARERIGLKKQADGYFIEARLPALGWLRVPAN